MQKLEVVARLFPQIESGAKRSTIRWRETPIRPGPMIYVCQDAPERTLVVEVTRVTRMPLRAAAAFVGRKGEWPDPVMLTGMREHYPDIGLDDVVEVIEHLPPSQQAGCGTRSRD